MNRLLSASLLALGVTYAMPSVAQSVQGGHLYIQDLDAPVVITYEPSKSTHNNLLYIAGLDADGKLVGGYGAWETLLRSTGTSQDIAVFGNCYTCLMTGKTYSYTPAAGVVELVFFWANETTNKTFYSGPANGKAYDSSGNLGDLVTYTATGAKVGFEDGGGTPPKNSGWSTDWDWNDVVITLTNVGGTLPPLPPIPPPPPPPIPEPETYAMMLAGLGLIGAVVRRRRIGQ